VHENFIALEREKRDRIINAALREFSTKGFKNASTNEIVKKAGISKGALFHYFSSKQDLFAFLYRYCSDFFMETVLPHINDMPVDVFDRWMAFTALKIEIAAQYPAMADFMQSAYWEDAFETQGFLKAEFDRFSNDFYQKIYNGIDFSKFKPDIDTAKALQIIWWVLEGYSLAKQKEPLDLSKLNSEEFLRSLINEIESYLNMLKSAFYKEEYTK